MAVIAILFTLFIVAVFTVDFLGAILEIRRDRAALRAQWRKTQAGGFSV